MSKIAERLRSILDGAEKELRELIAEAARSGDYEGIDAARVTAGRVRDIIASTTVDARMTTDRASRARTGTPVATQLNGAQTPRKPRKGEYPRFYVEKDLLYKVGWSKAQKAEYVHKIPKEAYESTLRVISELADSGKGLFTAEQIVQRLESRGSPVPIYQVYVTMALLRDQEIVQQKGREGYVSEQDVVAQGTSLWSTL